MKLSRASGTNKKTQDTSDSAGHIPVMLPEVLRSLAPTDGEIYIDGTFGAGGYSRAILDAAKCTLYGFDRDPRAVKAAQEFEAEYNARFISVYSDFGAMREKMNDLGVEKIDGIVLDIGVSSMQIDMGERGFSFQKDGPLDMRMDDGEQHGIETAAALIDRLSEDELANIIYTYGDERKSRRIARGIKLEQAIAPITTTLRLAEIVKKANPQSPKIKTHAATKTFQALRIAVNDELGQLEKALAASLTLLKEGGRLVVVTFHSLEDRLVKQFLRRYSGRISSGSRYAPDALIREGEHGGTVNYWTPQSTKKAVDPSAAEIAENPRSRSARLRFAVRTEHDFDCDEEVLFHA